MHTPLLLACRSAFAWLDAIEGQNADTAAKVYHGDGYNIAGEVEQDAYLARQYPNFQQLLDGGFSDGLERLYRPLWQLILGTEQRKAHRSRSVR